MSATLGSAIDSGASCSDCSRALPASACLNAGLAPNNLATDSAALVEGDSLDFTFNLSAMYEPRETRLGVAYRHSVDHTLDGDVDFDLSPALAGVVQANSCPFAEQVVPAP